MSFTSLCRSLCSHTYACVLLQVSGNCMSMLDGFHLFIKFPNKFYKIIQHWYSFITVSELGKNLSECPGLGRRNKTYQFKQSPFNYSFHLFTYQLHVRYSFIWKPPLMGCGLLSVFESLKISAMTVLPGSSAIMTMCIQMKCACVQMTLYKWQWHSTDWLNVQMPKYTSKESLSHFQQSFLICSDILRIHKVLQTFN